MRKIGGEKIAKNSGLGIHISIALFVLLFVFFLYMLGDISKETLDRQEKSLNTAINRSIVSCYCVEGTYPPSLEYIEEHYGLIYDKDTFFVDYQIFGSNIYPDVTILRKEGR